MGCLQLNGQLKDTFSLQIGFTFSVPVAKTAELSGPSSVSEPITSSSGKILFLIIVYIKIG